MSELANRSGFELIRVDAIDAMSEQNTDALAALNANGPTGRIGIGALACSLSHAKAWQMFLQSDATRAVFLEDDVVVSADFAAVTSDILNGADELDLIKLECGGSAKDGLVLGAAVSHPAGRSLRPCYQVATDAAGYVLTRTGAQQALARLADIDVPVDHFLFYPLDRKGCAGLRYGIVDPAILIQDRSIGSNISTTRYTDGKFSRMLKRTFYEAAPVPNMLSKLLFSGAKIQKVPFVETRDTTDH